MELSDIKNIINENYENLLKRIENQITGYENQIEIAREEGMDHDYWEGCRDSLRILLYEVKKEKE